MQKSRPIVVRSHFIFYPILAADMEATVNSSHVAWIVSQPSSMTDKRCDISHLRLPKIDKQCNDSLLENNASTCSVADTIINE